MEKKTLINYCLRGIGVLVVFTYLYGISDGVFQYSGKSRRFYIESIRYYILWVLPNWWLIILVGGLMIGFTSYFIKRIIDNL